LVAKANGGRNSLLMKCPYCAEKIKEEALKCKHCGEWLRHSGTSQTGDLHQSSQIRKVSPRISESSPSRDIGQLILDVTESFSLYKKAFTNEGTIYSYDGISSICYMGNIMEVNAVNIGSDASLFITHEDLADDIHIKASTYVIRTKKFKNIGKAANIISKGTFKWRMDRYLVKLQRDGFFIYSCSAGDIKIFKNGDITDGKHKFNLTRAREQKALRIGYDFQFGLHRDSKPHEVVVSETGTAVWHKKIEFRIYRDFDVMTAILKVLSGDDS
jgi:hypothetical protein